jgi:hypothetical protein
MGLEVTPITALTARQYGISENTRGLAVAEAEGQAATAGVKAGDVVVSVNGAPITNMVDFFKATSNGTASQGVLGIDRKGQKLSVNVPPPTSPPPGAPPNTVGNPPAGRAAPFAATPQGTSPQGTSPIAPANATQWNCVQGLGGAGRTNPVVGWPQQL